MLIYLKIAVLGLMAMTGTASAATLSGSMSIVGLYGVGPIDDGSSILIPSGTVVSASGDFLSFLGDTLNEPFVLEMSVGLGATFDTGVGSLSVGVTSITRSFATSADSWSTVSTLRPEAGSCHSHPVLCRGLTP